jgi:exonuclease VII large subunit
MKRKNREINIFSMSALDLFASAMGAFLLIAVMALPYYLKVDKKVVQEAQETKKRLKECEQQRVKLEARNRTLTKENAQLKSSKSSCEREQKRLREENEELKNRNSECQKKLQKTFCVVTIKWESSSKQDVDLHIIDPQGREYFYNKMTHRGSSAFLAVDSKGVKRGAEVWVDKKLNRGKYKIYYVYYAGTAPLRVKGSVLTSSFTKDLPTKTLIDISQSKRIKVATINVDSSGQATLEID